MFPKWFLFNVKENNGLEMVLKPLLNPSIIGKSIYIIGPSKWKKGEIDGSV